jgi:cell division protease FtsH
LTAHREGNKLNKTPKAILFWLVIVVSALLLWQVVRTNPADQNTPEISYSRFLSQVADGQVRKVTISGQQVRGYETKGGSFRVTIPPEQSTTLAALQQHGVEIWIAEAPQGNWNTWILNLAPLALLAALWFFMIRQLQTRSRRSASGFGPPPSPDS